MSPKVSSHMGSKVTGLAPAVVALCLGALAILLPDPAAAEDIYASIIRGGRLYDSWYMEIGAPPPTESHPAYPQDKAYAGDPARNWRCVECHGWDYRGKDGAFGEGRHYTGIVGIDEMAGADPLRIIAILKDDTHAFRKAIIPALKNRGDMNRDELAEIIKKAMKDKSYLSRGWIDDQDYVDLANFVSLGQVDMDRFIDRGTGMFKGDEYGDEAFYITVCASCHGSDGKKIRNILPLGRLVREHPWKSLHKILNGHPGKRMPSLRMFETRVLVNVLAFARTLPADENVASILRGGRLYDNWYLETGRPAPNKSHEAYPEDRAFADDPGRNWLCVECHGWDYRGKDGVYATGEHFTGIKGISAMAGADPKRIVTLLEKPLHGFGKALRYRDLQDLANFVSQGQIDMNQYIDQVSGVFKNAELGGEAFFETICANCHGTDGKKIKSMKPLGKIVRERPWESLHNVLNGHPATQMPSLRMFETEVMVNILAYVQTLPVDEMMASIMRGGRLYDNWYVETGSPIPKKSHPAYPRHLKYADQPKANWRCVECHGWDYRGRSGVYGKGRHYTGIKGISRMSGGNVEEIIGTLKDKYHGYDDVLSEGDLKDIANFVGYGQVDTDLYIDRKTKEAKSLDPGNQALYSTFCATCHDGNGRGIITARPLGKMAVDRPWESLHKILNGHPGKRMPTLRSLDADLVTSLLAYTQTLPLTK